MEPLIAFWQRFPMQGGIKMAIKMIEKDLHEAKVDLDKKDVDDYKHHLLEAYHKLEAILNEIGLPPQA